MAKKRNLSDKDQRQRFIQAANELGCDDTSGEDEIMRRLAAQKRHEPPCDPKKSKTNKPAKS